MLDNEINKKWDKEEEVSIEQMVESMKDYEKIIKLNG